MSFNDIYNLANDYLHHRVSDKRSFTHNVGKTDDNLFKVNLFLYYNDRVEVDFERELGYLDWLREDWKLAHWERFSIFQKTKAESEHDFDNLVIFTSICTSLDNE